MNQTPPTPAQRLAAKIRARTNDTRDILDLLHEIAQGEHDATEHDKLNATGILFDRGYGKTPKQAPVSIDPAPETDDDEAAIHESPPETDDSDVGALREAPATESPRLVTQLDDSLHQSIGPPPEADPDSADARGGEEPALSEAEGSIQSIIRDHIISITNDGDTLIDVLVDIAWPEDPSTKPFHRNKAGKMLLERGAGTDPTPNVTTVRARMKPVLSDEDYPDYPPGYVFDPTKDCIYCSQSLNMPEGHEGEHRFDHEGLAKAFEEIEQKLEEQGITLDPNPPKRDWHISSPSKKWVANNIDVIREEAAKFQEELDLRIERRKAWPAIEERRRKKLAQIYPSHSEDDDPPDP